MDDESRAVIVLIHPSSLILHPFSGRRSQVVRQRSAKPLFIGSIPIAASNTNLRGLHRPLHHGLST